MVTSEELQRELSNIRREIDELREYELEIEMILGATHGRLKWLRAPRACLLKKSIGTRIQSLRLRYNMVHNCYLTVKRDEERKPLKNGSGARSDGANPMGRTLPDANSPATLILMARYRKM